MTNIFINDSINEDSFLKFIEQVNSTPDKFKICVYLSSDGGNPYIVPAFRDVIERYQMELVACHLVCSAALDLFLLTNTPRRVLETTICLVHRLLITNVDIDKIGNPAVEETLLKNWKKFNWDTDIAKLFDMSEKQIIKMNKGKDYYFDEHRLVKALNKSIKKFANKK